MSTPKHGYLYRLEWRRATPPPDGQPRMLGEAFATRTSPGHEAEHLAEQLRTIGFGCGYGLSVTTLSPPARRHTPEQRGRQRQRNLERRVTTGRRAIGPLFAGDVIQAELAARPAHYAGHRDPAHEAFVSQLDADDAQRWAAFLAWHAQTHPVPERGVTPFWATPLG